MLKYTKGIMGAGLLSLITTFGAGCGQEECQCPDACYENVCGVYDVAYNAVEKDPDDIVLPDGDSGEFELDVLRCNENKIKFSIYQPMEYDFDPKTGDVAFQKQSEQEFLGVTVDYEVGGNIKNGNLSLDATADVNYPENHPKCLEGCKEHVKYHLDGTKKIGDTPQEFTDYQSVESRDLMKLIK